MKSNKQGIATGRKPKVKKDGLTGWVQEDECLLQEDIGIDTWYEDRKQSGRERGYVCALVESYERQEKARQYKSRNSSSRRTQRNSASTASKTSLANQNKSTTKQKETMHHNNHNKTSLLSNTDVQGSDQYSTRNDHVISGNNDPIGALNNHVILSQLERENNVSNTEGHWANEFISRNSADDSGNNNGSAFHNSNEEASPPENLAMVNLIRYEEKLRKRRENRLRKSMEIIKKTENVDISSPCKKAANITSVTFAEGMIQPINDIENNTKRTPHKSHSKTKLPSIVKTIKQNTEDIQSKTINSPKSGSDSPSKNPTERSETHNGKNGTKFNFDILEKYASIRNSKSKASFVDYVEKMRSLRYCGTEDNGLGLHCNPEDNILKEALSKGGSQLFNGTIGNSLTFEHVRELWYESQRDRIVKKVNRRTRSLPSYNHSNEASKMMMVVDVKSRNRCMSEPVDGGNKDKEIKYCSSMKGKYHGSKHRCPLQRMLSATNRRLEANKMHGPRKENQIIKNTENETVELTRTENGIKCCVLGRCSPSNNQTASQ